MMAPEDPAYVSAAVWQGTNIISTDACSVTTVGCAGAVCTAPDAGRESRNEADRVDLFYCGLF